MKKFLLFPALTVAAFLAACGDDDSSSRKVITEVNSIYELGICGEDNQGDTVYATLDANAVPEPSTWALLILGVITLFLRKRARS